MNRTEIEESKSGILMDFQGSKNLLVSFGGIRQGIGLPVFEFFNSISDIPCDKLFLRDFGQAWYQKGVDHKVTHFDDLRLYLAKIIEDNKYKKICFLGNSMGAYGALLFGTMLKVDKIIAFAPQSYIDVNNKLRNFDFRWPKQILRIYMYKRKQKKYFDLKNYLIENQSVDTSIDVFYSPNHRLDKNHSERLQSLSNINLIPIKRGGHSIVKTIRDEGKLKDIIKSVFL